MPPVDHVPTEVLTAIIAHPDFRATVEGHCARRVKAQAEMGAVTRWMTRDLGRFGLANAVVVLDGMPGGVTAAALFQAAQANGSSSRGRVTKFIDHAQRMGGLVIPPGDTHWTRRRLQVRPALSDPIVEVSRAWITGAARLLPEIGVHADRVDDRDWMVRYTMMTTALTVAHRHLLAAPDLPMALFATRDGGMPIFCDLVSSQAADRRRLLDTAPLSRNGLAQRNNVSRTQIQRLLADGEAAGLFACTRDRIEFTPAMSADAERHFALGFHINRLAAGLMTEWDRALA